MPYGPRETPSGTEGLPAHARAVFRAAFNSAAGKYEDEGRRFRVAWSAVRRAGYRKNKAGRWVAGDGALLDEAVRLALRDEAKGGRPSRARDWNPDQPREPAGGPGGGQWTSGGGGGGGGEGGARIEHAKVANRTKLRGPQGKPRKRLTGRPSEDPMAAIVRENKGVAPDTREQEAFKAEAGESPRATRSREIRAHRFSQSIGGFAGNYRNEGLLNVKPGGPTHDPYDERKWGSKEEHEKWRAAHAGGAGHWGKVFLGAGKLTTVYIPTKEEAEESAGAGIEHARPSGASVSFDRKKLGELEKAYEQARSSGAEQFKFEGHDVLTSYGKYMLEYLHGQLGAKGKGGAKIEHARPAGGWMPRKDAVDVIVDLAGRWGENAEEELPHRLSGKESDQELTDMLRGADPQGREPEGWEVDNAKRIRDLWRATGVLRGEKAEGMTEEQAAGIVGSVAAGWAENVESDLPMLASADMTDDQLREALRAGFSERRGAPGAELEKTEPGTFDLDLEDAIAVRDLRRAEEVIFGGGGGGEKIEHAKTLGGKSQLERAEKATATPAERRAANREAKAAWAKVRAEHPEARQPTPERRAAQRVLERWARKNPDDAGEHDAEDIYSRFKGQGVTRAQAGEFHEKLQAERYGPAKARRVKKDSVADRRTTRRDWRGREEGTWEEEDDEKSRRLRGDSLVARTPLLAVCDAAGGEMMFDQVTIDDEAKVRFTDDGFMVATPRVARVGVQVYRGSEVNKPELDTVRVYRPADEVFDAKAMRSFAHRPMTIDHPAEPVRADNWRKHAVGQTGEEVLRDGNAIRVPMVLMDAAAIQAYRDGKRELSVGYDCDLDWTPGVADGEPYDAVQRNIRANHLAVVAAARGGPTLKIGDDLTNHQTTGDQTMNMRTIIVDGIECQMADTAALIVQRTIQGLQDQVENFKKKAKNAEDDEEEWAEDSRAKDAAIRQRDEAIKARDAEIAKRDEALRAKDAEVAAARAQLKDAQDEMSPDKLDARVVDRLSVVGKAKAFLGDKWTAGGKNTLEIRREVVAAKVGDAAKGWNDQQVEAAFATLQVPTFSQGRVPERSPIDDAVSVFGRPGGGYTTVQDEKAKAYADYDKSLNDAWRGPQQQH